MLRIRLSRQGRRNAPFYRIIVSERHKDTFAGSLENLGFYNPRSKEVGLKADRIKYWLSVGAQPSATVHNLLVEHGVIEGKKVRASKLSKKRREKLAEKQKDKQEVKQEQDQSESEENKESQNQEDK